MNWRLSMLDDFAIVSNSDAHSGSKLAQEATCFDMEFSYLELYNALRSRDRRIVGTIEFYPEEGKYHLDGHRKCDVCWQPAQSIAAGNLCPVCGKKLTIGVLHRVEELADRASRDTTRSRKTIRASDSAHRGDRGRPEGRSHEKARSGGVREAAGSVGVGTADLEEGMTIRDRAGR